MQLKKILFPTNFEDLSMKIVENLLFLKDAGLEEIVFLFVVDRDEVAFNLFRGFDRDYAEELKESARLRFVEWEKLVEAHGVKASYIVEIGNPEGKILEIGCRENVDMIVAGRRRHMPADAVYLSGTTMGVLRRTTMPLMIYKSKLHNVDYVGEVPRALDHVVFATDFSESAKRAFEFIKCMSGAVGKVELMHVLTERDFRRHSPEEIKAEEERCIGLMNDMAGQLEKLGIKTGVHVFAGNTVNETVGCCVDNNCTAIIMGTTGKHGIKEAWLGSASHRVVEKSPTTVILVPEESAICYV